ncbi:MAG: 6-phosphogluconate dehydrogenase, decarboxylating [Candidatus Curtissbacteria bacterium GW2011_GWA1_40_16]|uniref:6-phosphogluconate dehydrogenase, decarboxylating n=1 Tax=Candidatus Curtissbacteria bacterium GW2011_GWA1_40_16 TaxID=1618405 RepID=A0A0G0TVU2_9BACT|nr:MAG: 6-phosphogluconate dehydrogenase, decarboxylating [Candidatus Curtissbacteria bacterium GW2011_GWA1_40_16]
MKVGFIGLGKMGNRMVTKLLSEGHEVVVWNRTEEKVSSIKDQVSSHSYKDNLKTAESIQDLVGQLEKPRVIWLMVPAGDATKEVLAEVGKFVEEGDIVVDGGNSKFSDTEEEYKKFEDKNVRFLGIGVSGGLIAATEGYPMMAGGDKSAFDHIKPILDSLAKPRGGYEYFGEGGAGHFVKMVHNAIEYGYMQSIGEGFGVLKNASYKLDLEKVAKLYQKGTLISGFMMERTVEALEKDPKMEQVAGVIGTASGETVWTVDFAKENDLPIEIIERSLEIRRESETDEKIQKSFAARLVGSLRIVFGGHPVRQAQGKPVKNKD